MALKSLEAYILPPPPPPPRPRPSSSHWARNTGVVWQALQRNQLCRQRFTELEYPRVTDLISSNMAHSSLAFCLPVIEFLARFLVPHRALAISGAAACYSAANLAVPAARPHKHSSRAAPCRFNLNSKKFKIRVSKIPKPQKRDTS